MAKKTDVKKAAVSEEEGFILKWGKFVARVAAIGATITGAFTAFFSTSSVTSGIALTAAGASTLAAANKLPEQRYVKTKHVPPGKIAKSQRKALPSDILAKPERIVTKFAQSSGAASTGKPSARTSISIPRTKV